LAITLEVITGPQAGTRVVLPPGESVVGRSPTARLQLTDPAASFEHAVMRCGDAGITVENLSAHGTFLNGKRIAAEASLRAKDRITLGGSELAIDIGDAGVTTQPNRAKLSLALLLVIATLLLASTLFTSGPQPEPARSELQGRQIMDAYAHLDRWLRQEVAREKMPLASLVLLTEAWRLDRANRYAEAAAVFGRLLLLLRSLEVSGGAGRNGSVPAHDGDALLRLFAGGDPSRRTAMGLEPAALIQFVRFRFEKNTEFARPQP